MKAPLTLRRPSNWQDFESLAKKLWGEIWQCPEIQKNGRLGQSQSGVDVFGIPKGDTKYYGIQCKGKNEYVNAQFSENEINEEISKAINFKPPLKKYYLITTAENDAKIQEFVRNKNIEHIEKNLFEVHLFSWESIVDLIEENRGTYDWYVKSQNFKSNKSVSVLFQNGHSEITLIPKFKKTNIQCVQKIIPAVDPLIAHPLYNFMKQQQKLTSAIFSSNVNVSTINLSYVPIFIVIHNNGNDPIEEFKLKLEFFGKIQDIADTNEKGAINLALLTSRFSNTHILGDSKTVNIIPKHNILVGDDSIESDYIYVKPHVDDTEILIKWSLISKDFKDKGELKMEIQPDVVIENKSILVEDPLKVGFQQSYIEDFIEDKKNGSR